MARCYATALQRSECNSRRISTAGIAGLNRQPCISSQPGERGKSCCCEVSTPSAIVTARATGPTGAVEIGQLARAWNDPKSMIDASLTRLQRDPAVKVNAARRKYRFEESGFFV